ncbi:MAG: P-II family nitrogen regulator [Bacillota bacterium]|uniref:Nitrogen regulatory protein P-II family n=2 Tax=Carboxydocella TaxID=178898 RepID=A0A1T4PRB2_9FIRM|nr:MULTISPECIES: P-II family nitrogen regulator [Carboxydocella]AVX19680.1 nitrogen regulatory protein P-II family [Carboxydocella thermautotrophica]AVX30085.1 nitrogen regulatory protein P-II family [Carboxydocella thermautotrophica]SJZ94120.1 nitrogen regulatory protein P-II family [Carboxydocella sporoproducens DSM 16521]GAW29542.1 nitrogen regulatory protein P-II [Carboxydocella sp. ULO1]GAW31328.1 nitrogen regulatory protein P-II [Carboxydocella sp. JDF658]
MKKIEAVIRPEKLNEVKQALEAYGIKGMTVSQVVGCGLQKGRTQLYRGTEINLNLLPKVKLELVVPNACVEEIMNVILNSACTGAVGDGKIFVTAVENAIRIRTGEEGEAALT